MARTKYSAPNNDNSRDRLAVFDLHVHTVRGSSDSSLTPKQLIEKAKEIGLDGVCLTEHGGGWDQQEFDRVFAESGIIAVRGLEVDTDMGHILVFGLHAYVNGMHRVKDLRRAVDRAGGVMVSAHPFRNLFNHPPYNTNFLFKNAAKIPETPAEAANHPLFEVVDDIEIANGSNTDQENDFARKVARVLEFGGTGGSDVHSIHGLGKCVTILDGEIRTEAEFVEALRAKAFRAATGLNVGNLQTLD